MRTGARNRVPYPVLYGMLYGRGMAKKPVTIRVDEDLHALLKKRAEAEGTSVTALIEQAAADAVRDPRLETAGDVFRAFIDKYAGEFDAAFPADAPGRLDRPGRAA
jgi:predicted transcriptional regulator